jgi:hypothetical protein
VYAQHKQDIKVGFQAIATALSLDSDDGPISLVKKWLDCNPHWLLVLDDISDLSSLSNCLPLRPQGDILIMTRDEALVGSALIGSGFKLQLPNESESVSLFTLCLHGWSPDEEDLVWESVQELFTQGPSRPGVRSVLETLASNFSILAYSNSKNSYAW